VVRESAAAPRGTEAQTEQRHVATTAADQRLEVSRGLAIHTFTPIASSVPSQRYRQQRVEMTAVADHKPLGEPQTATFVANPVEVDTGRE